MSIIAQSIGYTHPDREVLFQHINFSVGTGQKAALVGNNGTGKSTLLQVVAGLLPASGGSVQLSGSHYYVPQHLGQYNGQTVAQVLGVAEQLQALQAILNGDASEQHFAILNDEWDIEERVQAALTYWQLQHLDLNQTMDTLSGGEKTKVFMAGTLVHQPQIILLDEPSNHLDGPARALLYQWIAQTKSTVLVVSHDISLLNQLDITLEITRQGVTLYGGNYDFYRAQRDGQLTALQAQVDDKQKALKQAKQKARDLAEQRQRQEARGRAAGKSQSLPRIVAGNLQRQAEQSTAKMKAIQGEKLDSLSTDLQQLRTQVQEQQVLKIDLRRSDLHRGKLLVDLQAVNVTFNGQPLWAKAINFQLRSGERVRVAGRNGSGKTSLLRLLMEGQEPDEGQVVRAPFTCLYLDQEYSAIDNRLTVLSQLQQHNQRYLPEHDLKMLLYYHQFNAAYWNRPCAALSGGEKMKLLLCCMAVNNHLPNVLILDEPTNNLDVQSQEVLTTAIRSFEGTLLVISHDQYFVEQIGVEREVVLG
jgi:ATPase subunit of ABC transporter with duplicated ATPase domains